MKPRADLGTQARVLAFIKAYLVREGGVSPTVREIMVGVGYRSPSRVHAILGDLEECGQILRHRGHARAIRILGSGEPPREPGKVPIYRASDHKLMAYLP